MRILFLSNYYPPHQIGGYEELCADVAEELVNRGHHVVILTSSSGLDRNKGEENIYRLLLPVIDSKPYKAATDFFLHRSNLVKINLAILRSTIDRCRPDVIMIWGMWNLPNQLLALAESANSYRVVYYLADYWPSLPDAYTLYWQEPARHSANHLLKSLLKTIALNQLAKEPPPPKLKFENTLCVSNYVRQTLSQSGIIPINSQVVHNGINLSHYSFAPRRQRLLDEDNHLNLLLAGRITPDKGAHILLNALQILSKKGRSFTLTILGSGNQDYLRRLETISKELIIEQRLNFIGHVPRSQVPRIMVDHDVLIVPSVWPDPLPRIIQESMAVGTAVVGSDAGGIPEIIDHNINGLLFSQGSADSLATQIDAIFQNPGMLERIVEAGRATVENKFSLQQMIDTIETYLKHLINQK